VKKEHDFTFELQQIEKEDNPDYAQEMTVHGDDSIIALPKIIANLKETF
jgi:hypothetical protein